MNPESRQFLLGAELLLRPLEESDQFEALGILGDRRIMRHCGGALSADSADAFCRDAAHTPDRCWIVERRGPGTPVGLVRRERAGGHLDFLLKPDFWGRGWATQLFWLMLRCRPDLVGERMHLPRDNAPARRVAERCGYWAQPVEGGEMELVARKDRELRLEMLDEYFREQRERRRDRLNEDLGFSRAQAHDRGLPPVAEALLLESRDLDCAGRTLWLTPAAQDAWEAMRDAAARDGVVLEAVSGFRDMDYQAGLLRRKLERGQAPEEILRVNALPGYSEHHSGAALDLNTPGCPVLEEEFEQTDAFAWLEAHASEHGFQLSYPRDNPHGIAYEPWHWAFGG